MASASGSLSPGPCWRSSLILVLDEPAEHLDPLTADVLSVDLLLRVTDGRSLVFITHRLLGLDTVDEILVVDAGRVVERGSHEELLDRGGRAPAVAVGRDENRET